MTALVTKAGMLPLARGIGSWAQLLQPLAIAVIGGVAVSMVLSLVITPVVLCGCWREGVVRAEATWELRLLQSRTTPPSHPGRRLEAV
jgi:Cu/Ag efflux pump CusA